MTGLVLKWSSLVLHVMYTEDADETVNRGDPDQTAPMEQSDLALHCLLRLICPKA